MPDQSAEQKESDKAILEEHGKAYEFFEKYRGARRLIVVFLSFILLILIFPAVLNVWNSKDIGSNYMALCIAYIGLYTIIVSFYFASRSDMNRSVNKFAGMILKKTLGVNPLDTGGED